MDDRGRDTSYSLTKVRTVLGRAETAVDEIIDYAAVRGFDPDHEEMIAALTVCIHQLSRWRRTGRPLKGRK